MKDHMQLERKYLQLGDIRRNERFIKIVNIFTNSPNLSVPNTFPYWYDLKATYTFWKSKNVNYSDIHNSIVMATIERARNHETVLCIQDTTNISFGIDAKGLGYLDHGLGKGFLCHNNICFTTKGIPIGILDIFPWGRKFENIGKSKTRTLRDISEKESYRFRYDRSSGYIGE